MIYFAQPQFWPKQDISGTLCQTDIKFDIDINCSQRMVFNNLHKPLTCHLAPSLGRCHISLWSLSPAVSVVALVMLISELWGRSFRRSTDGKAVFVWQCSNIYNLSSESIAAPISAYYGILETYGKISRKFGNNIHRLQQLMSRSH